MPGRTRVHKMSVAQESEMRMRVLDVLNNADVGLTTDDIKSRDMVLAPLTSQKLSRILSYLIEMGFVRKARSKAQGRMVYKAVSKMQEQGYEVDEDYVPGGRTYNGLEWDFEDEISALTTKEDESDGEEI